MSSERKAFTGEGGLEQLVAKTLDEHIVYHGAPRQRSACRCGHLFEAQTPHDEHLDHIAAAVLAAQHDAGYAVVDATVLRLAANTLIQVSAATRTAVEQAAELVAAAVVRVGEEPR